MAFQQSEFETVEKKDVDGSRELLKLRNRNGILALVLAPKNASSGAIFGGHNWEEIGRHPALIDNYFHTINSGLEFVALSAKVRQNVQALIEGGRI